MNIQEIVKEIKKGNLSRNNDETYAGGFWDLAGSLANSVIAGLSNSEAEGLQENIYNALWEVYESTKN